MSCQIKSPPRSRYGLVSLMLLAGALPLQIAQAVDVKTPVCKILSPQSGINLDANHNVTFNAQAILKDNTSAPLKYEWDFSGGVFGELIHNSNPPAYKRPDSLKTTVQFVRNNARYRVHFSAMDAQKRRCDASIDVVVGTSPSGLPNVSAMVNESLNTAPKNGSQLAGKAGDLVVLPYPEMTMQAQPDARYQQNLYVPSTGSFNSLNAQVYEKDRLPRLVDNKAIKLRYKAAVNKNDPVGSGSINSTSQNYPLGAANEAAPWQDALIQKSDMWEKTLRPKTDLLSKDYLAMAWVDGFAGGAVKPDEGFKVDSIAFASRGSYMPSIDNPFVSNDFQDFIAYDTNNGVFSARNLPITDIDDSGRVNPYPLMRIQAFDAATDKPIANAAVDTVMTAGKDFHCTECHEKGKIAANPAIDFSQFKKAFHSSSEYNNGYHCQLPDCDKTKDFAPPTFYEAVDKDGKPSDNLADRDYAAVRNAMALHDFYDHLGLNYWTDNGSKDEKTGAHGMDMAAQCTWCHGSMVIPDQKTGYPGAFTTNNGKKSGDMMYYPSLSESLHRFHGRLQLDPSDKSKILRQPNGRPWQWDDSKGMNPNSLFPSVDAKGNALPMEQSCLRCHSGHREQLFRDRMFTAGVTCFDCHGDMGAAGQAHKKAKLGQEGSPVRVEWLEQPNCGSCHIGDGNKGKDAKNGFFSAGVMKRAFDLTDKAASSRKPLTDRFAVQPITATEIAKNDWLDPQYSTRYSVWNISSPLYRKSHDAHGNVPCAACHGGAHEIRANRNPNANDNVTANQLQGHSGVITECNVCHTADAFKNMTDLDAGRFMKDGRFGILGGPHNMHPVNDAEWIKTSTAVNGWHINYTAIPDQNGKEQCAGCHGSDHKGTRLSKTPVDRVFDFSTLDANKFAAIGFKAKTIKVAAGSVMGCDTCHSIQSSCKGSPAGAQCGIASENITLNPNHDPVIRSKATQLKAVMGDNYSYVVQADDADGDKLTYSLGLKPAPISDDKGNVIAEMKIDATGKVTAHLSEKLFADYKHGPFTLPYSINVSDGKGGYAVQNVELSLDCPAGKKWLWNGGMWDAKVGSCVNKTDVSVTSKTSVGINSGELLSYSATAKDAKNLPMTYSLVNNGLDLEGISIDRKTGVVTWNAHTVWYGQSYFQVKATNSKGVSDTQLVTLTVCVPAKKWNADKQSCQ